MQGRCILVAGILALLAAADPLCAQDAPWQRYKDLTEIEIPFANGPISTGYVPEVWLKLPGSAPRRFGLDTGSTGIVVAAERYTPAPGDVQGGPGRLVYNSSGRILSGTLLHDRCRHPARRQCTRRHGARAGAAGHRDHLPGARARLPARTEPARRGLPGRGLRSQFGARHRGERAAESVHSPGLARLGRAACLGEAGLRRDPDRRASRHDRGAHLRLRLREAGTQRRVAARRTRMERRAHDRFGRRRHGQRHDPDGYRHQLHVPLAARRHAAGAGHARAGRHEDRRLSARQAHPAARLLRLHGRRARQSAAARRRSRWCATAACS